MVGAEWDLMKELYFENRKLWREWLAENQNVENEGIWLIYYKKEADKPTLSYEASVEEALCYGWIDSIIKKLDDERYLRKFTPRKPDSLWSDANKKRVEKLMLNGQMTEIGLVKINAAKQSGIWEKSPDPGISYELPEEFERALAAHPTAQDFFNTLAPSYQKQYIGWIAVAKRAETRDKRIAESISLLKKGEKLGMK